MFAPACFRGLLDDVLGDDDPDDEVCEHQKLLVVCAQCWKSKCYTTNSPQAASSSSKPARLVALHPVTVLDSEEEKIEKKQEKLIVKKQTKLIVGKQKKKDKIVEAEVKKFIVGWRERAKMEAEKK